MPNPLPGRESLWLTDEKGEEKVRGRTTGREEVESEWRTHRSGEKDFKYRSGHDNFQMGITLMIAT